MRKKAYTADFRPNLQLLLLQKSPAYTEEKAFLS